MTANPFDITSYDDCGFDISHWNTGINFQLLGTTGNRKYCILKLTEGTTDVDSEFIPFMRRAIPSNIKRFGVYHFAHHDNPIGQMQYFIEQFIIARKQLNNPPEFLFMLDLERGANPPLEADGLYMVQYLQGMHINPIIYCGYDFFSQNHTILDDCPCMVAAYNNHPISPIPWRIPSATIYGFDFWQYEGDSLGPWAGPPLPGGSVGMDRSCFNLKKHPQGLDLYWDAQLIKTKQPT